jgi:protein CpxP
MNLRSSRSALLALGIGAALTAGLVPLVSAAQPQQLPANPQTNRTAPPPDRGDARDFDRRAEERLDRRLDFLHSELHITPAQEQAWAAFADAVRGEGQQDRDRSGDRRDQFRGGPDGRGERPGIVERLERRQQRLEDESAHYERLLRALRPLYAALNEEQRQAADENLFSPGREDRFRRGPRRFGVDGRFGGEDFSGSFDRPFGPFPPRYDRSGRIFYR